mgnify:CR=1 FL=1|tara:strand:+ start:11383 stop:12312 length:930 start_codon:yes stop_codon:yes gene_type:complete
MNNNNDDIPVVEKKKRGRKPKPKPDIIEPVLPKKRGRKPKGGKIITNPVEKSIDSEYITENVILHLKCNTEDINNNDIDDVYAFEPNTISYHILDEISESIPSHKDIIEPEKEQITCETNIDKDNQKIISEKIIELQKNFYYNDIPNTNSACFWCTYNFDHTSVHIPKYKMNDKYHVYGCFCSPECAVAYLMNESIDSSQKFERYQLLNFIYNNIYNNEVNHIKPAPNPHYLLDKFMGNLTINEYRELLRQDRLFIVVDKPITRILPEIYEETDFKGIQMDSLKSKSSFQIKKKGTVVSKKTNFFNQNI